LKAAVDYLFFSIAHLAPQAGFNTGVTADQAKKAARDVVFLGVDDAQRGLEELRNDFLPILSCPDVRESDQFPVLVTGIGAIRNVLRL
jgi:hypothetical protein